MPTTSLPCSGRRTRRWSGVRRVTATSTPRCAGKACSTRCSRPATAASSCRTPTTSAPCRTRGWPAGSPPAEPHSPSRRCDGRRATARAATSPPAAVTDASCSGRPRRRCPRTRRRSQTWAGTASPPPTTCGSTSRPCAPSSTAVRASSGCRSSGTSRPSTRPIPRALRWSRSRRRWVRRSRSSTAPGRSRSVATGSCR